MDNISDLTAYNMAEIYEREMAKYRGGILKFKDNQTAMIYAMRIVHQFHPIEPVIDALDSALKSACKVKGYQHAISDNTQYSQRKAFLRECDKLLALLHRAGAKHI